jgi:phospholipid-binding lipoprotein MlaA
LGALLLAASLAGGCATIPNPSDTRDPLEPLNRATYSVNEHLDELLLKPAAIVYRDVLPPIVREGVGNFFSNIGDLPIALNNLLQGKVDQAASDVGRVAVNSTIGILGFVDVASKMGLEKHEEDFGQTLGRWGVGTGPYLVLPFFGPSDFRDGAGRLADYYTDPVTYIYPPHDRNILWGVRILSNRAQLLGASRVLEAAALDPYQFVRDAYLQRRRNLVYDGKAPPEDLDEDEKDQGKPGEDAKKSGKHSELAQPSPIARSAFDRQPVYSVLTSGEPLTPAEEEALQRAGKAPDQQVAVTSVPR